MRPVILLTIALTACSGGDPTDTDTGEPTDTDPPPCELEVPDPGDDPTPADWTSDDTNISPDTAWPVGVVADRQATPSYVQTILPNDEDSAYFVFKSGKDMNLPIHVQNSQNPFEGLHLHDATNLCFGDEIEQENGEVGPNFVDAIFAVEEDGIYVLEVRVPGGGFF